MKLVTLADLLYDDVAIGTLATAIEKHGIWGWDRYGRFRTFTHESDEGKEALNLLASQSAFSGDPEQELSPLDEADLQTVSPYDTFGWKDSELPDFQAIDAAESAQPPSPRPQSEQKSANAHLVVIGALLEYIKGKWDDVKAHPDFESEVGLMNTLIKHNPKVPGLALRGLQDKFAKAKVALSMQRELSQ